MHSICENAGLMLQISIVKRLREDVPPSRGYGGRGGYDRYDRGGGGYGGRYAQAVLLIHMSVRGEQLQAACVA